MQALRLCGVLLWLWSGLAMGAVDINSRQASHTVAQELSYLRDDSGQRQLADVLSAPADWQRNDNEIFNRGYNSATWWLRFDVRNTDAQLLRQLIEIAYPVLDEVEVWILREGKIREHHRVGDKRPFHDRPIDHRFFLIPLHIEAGQTDTVVLRVKTSSSVQVPLTLWDERGYYDNDQLRMLGQGVYFGTMMVMVLYNFFIFLIVGDRNYLYYVLYVLGMPLFLASMNGLAFQYLWPGATQWNDQAIVVSLSGAIVFGGLFTHRFLLLRQNLPVQISLFLLGLVGASALVIVASFFLPYALMIHLNILVATLACITCLVCGVLRWRQGDTTARLYTIAWSSMLLGGILLALNKFHFLPKNVLTENITQVGSAIEVILLSIALAERINQEKRLRFQAQQEALESERMTREAQAEAQREALEAERMVREAQAEALATQRRANETLEERVQERTLALEEANRKLAELSSTDQLTGLRNRRHLDTVLREEFVRCFRYKHSIAVLIMDIDHFKRFNDSYGHLVGDDCLRNVAAALKDAVRWPTDKVARYGGEEFCVVLPETDAEGACIVAERIRLAVEALEFEVNGERVPVTISVGVAAMVPEGSDASHLLVAAADKALYASKGRGRNCVTVDAPELDAAPDAGTAPVPA